MSSSRSPSLTAVHRALADPLRIRLYELLVLRPQSAKELVSTGRRTTWVESRTFLERGIVSSTHVR